MTTFKTCLAIIIGFVLGIVAFEKLYAHPENMCNCEVQSEITGFCRSKNFDEKLGFDFAGIKECSTKQTYMYNKTYELFLSSIPDLNEKISKNIVNHCWKKSADKIFNNMEKFYNCVEKGIKIIKEEFKNQKTGN